MRPLFAAFCDDDEVEARGLLALSLLAGGHLA